jgi:agmatine deiminase
MRAEPSTVAGLISDGVRMPAEWGPHRRTWMAYPCDPLVRESGAVTAWLDVAAAIVDDEPVTMLVPSEFVAEAQRFVDPRVELLVCDLDSCWLRDSGPTFVVAPSSLDRARNVHHPGLVGVCWTFNGWGGFADRSWERDAAVGQFVSGRAGARTSRSPLVAEGGAVHTDGAGTLLTTESVLLDPLRNPGWTRQEVDLELRRQLGARTVIWLPRGLTGDMTSLVGGNGTNGHIDVFCAWVRPGCVVLHDQPDPSHPDHDVLAEAFDILSAARDADGRPLRIVRIAAPPSRGGLHHDSYINFALTNRSVIIGTFGDTGADDRAIGVLAAEFPGRRVRTVDARPIFDNGGGVHCITQHEPAAIES